MLKVHLTNRWQVLEIKARPIHRIRQQVNAWLDGFGNRSEFFAVVCPIENFGF